jgi:hypothetical protein
MDPKIKLFHTACITDNAAGAVLLPDAAEQPEARANTFIPRSG